MSEQTTGPSAEHDDLLFFVNRLRDSVVRICSGPSDEQVRAPGVPSGTNLLGLVSHLTAMETLWFEGVFLGEAPDADGSMQVPGSRSRDAVLAAYRDACVRSDRIVRDCADLTTLSRGDARLPGSTDRDALPDEIRRVSLRRIVVHMIEETGRHAGHADIIRERIDGTTGG